MASQGILNGTFPAVEPEQTSRVDAVVEDEIARLTAKCAEMEKEVAKWTPRSQLRLEETSIIFVTLEDGEYNDYWSSDLVPLLSDETRAGYRELHWCGQRKKSAKDDIVGRGTLVAVRSNKKSMEFTIVGEVCEKMRISEKTTGHPATYKLLVEINAHAETIVRAPGDRCAHWTVLRKVGIPHNGGYMPEGIYAN
jgi:hypothetical protein